LLSHAPDGPSHLARFIEDLRSASNDPMAELQNHFSGLFEAGHGAEEVWEKHLARLSIGQLYQLLGSAETERVLDEMLRLKISDRGANKTYQLAEFPKFLKYSSAKSVLAVLAHDLGALATRANPIYRPIISEYSDATALLLHGKTRGLVIRFDRLRSARQAVTLQMRGIDDYLNWIEATSLHGGLHEGRRLSDAAAPNEARPDFSLPQCGRGAV